MGWTVSRVVCGLVACFCWFVTRRRSSQSPFDHFPGPPQAWNGLLRQRNSRRLLLGRRMHNSHCGLDTGGNTNAFYLSESTHQQLGDIFLRSEPTFETASGWNHQDALSDRASSGSCQSRGFVRLLFLLLLLSGVCFVTLGRAEQLN